ncbi:flavodoxin family protein [Moorella sp. Hama-1]|uniref:flavodoxin family protein n=1 Tax=Moorella sp. Hama-1 TaxID=2138101 RepID=UPI00137AE004|nr:flavodoxin family protein [Moorella sp. Hama-1]BCV22076.1 FMN reductase [Moorella sp. Hama-1]
MLVLGIAGSPRRQGNSELLLDAALAGAAEQGATTTKIIVTSLQINPCRGCDYCRRGHCVQRDDMDSLATLFAGAGALIIASPIFFYGVTAQLKALIDRCQVFWNRRYRLGKPVEWAGGTGRGALIAVGATRGDKLFLGSILTVKYALKALNLDYSRELLVRGVDEPGAIRQHPEQLEAALQLGRDLVAT